MLALLSAILKIMLKKRLLDLSKNPYPTVSINQSFHAKAVKKLKIYWCDMCDMSLWPQCHTIVWKHCVTGVMEITFKFFSGMDSEKYLSMNYHFFMVLACKNRFMLTVWDLWWMFPSEGNKVWWTFPSEYD